MAKARRSQARRGAALALFQDGGKASGELRQFDWASTPLGVPSRWDAALRMGAGTCMTSPQPMTLALGALHILLFGT